MYFGSVMTQDDIQNNKLQILGKLAASLAHEIRNPLSAIKLNLEFVKMSDVNDDVKDSVNSCIDAAERIQELIETTLDFSRASLNDSSYQSLNDVVNLAVEIMNTKAKILNIAIEKHLTKELLQIHFNKNKILQVILNLLTNAFEAIERDGIVRIKTYNERSGDENIIVLEVEDTGSGINEENKEKIFKDFYTNKAQGTGLGLSVCKMILDEYNAAISFNSELGKGTRFYVRFQSNR
jgi:signal transduction histidine kinase